MVFSCTLNDLVQHVLQNIAFSGNNGVSISELWSICGKKLKQSELDTFSKQLIWKLLFFNDKVKGSLFIWKDNQNITPEQDYDKFIQRNLNSESLRVYPSSETQWKFVTGREYSKKSKAQLGDYPFQLLCEIAKSGSAGIYAADLCKATNQDPRSLTVRLKKLEEMNLIHRVNAYHPVIKQHTSFCKHFSFTDSEGDLTSLEFSDDLNRSRDAEKLRNIIMQKIKQAPNGLRSLSDLKHELNLGTSLSTSKFFRSIVESLCKKGYLEKLMVKSSASEVKKQESELSNAIPDLSDSQDFAIRGTSPLVYCIKFLKDIPSSANDLNIQELMENVDDVEDNENKTSLPKVNNIFPITSQFYKQITSLEPAPSSMDLSTHLSGSSDYRPYVKLLDNVTTYVKDNGQLKKLHKFQNPYEGVVITRSYDFEGKFKFYRYFGSYDPVIDNSLGKLQKKGSNIGALNKKLFTSIGKIKDKTLPSRKRKAQDEASGSKRTKAVENDSKSIVEIKPPANFHEPKKDNSSSPVPATSSIKSTRRREELIEIVKESGGVLFTSANILRVLDKRLGNKTTTDMKTLVRDIAFLVHTGVVESRDIKTVKTGQQITRKLLIILDPQHRPSEDKIEEVKKLGEVDEVKRLFSSPLNRKVIDADVTLYSSHEVTRKSRLDTLSIRGKKSESKKEVKVKSESSGEVTELTSHQTEQSNDESNPLRAFIGSRFKGRKSNKKKGGRADNGTMGARKRALEFTRSDASKLFKLIVISRTFRKMIDFDHLAALFPNFSSKDVKQKWTAMRKKIGGQVVVSRAIERFEIMIRKSVEDGSILLADFEEPLDFKFFLNLWDKLDNVKLDDFLKGFYFNLSENYDYYDITENKEPVPFLFDQLENNSMRQKELIISNNVFYQDDPNNVLQTDKEVDEIKTTLRAIFLTDQPNFKSATVVKILSCFSNEKVQEVLEKMIRDREVEFNGLEDSQKSFLVTERFGASLAPLSTVPDMFRQASSFDNILNDLFKQNKALILSEAIESSHMMCLLNSVSNYERALIHVERPYKFTGYESRLIDKSKLDCEMVVTKVNELESDTVRKVAVPTGRACSRVWLDLTDRPGIRLSAIYTKFRWSITLQDLREVLKWLEDSNCLERGNYEDFWVKDKWFAVM